MAASVGSALVPESIGVVGVGTISSAAVRGLCRPDTYAMDAPEIMLSPRNAAKAKALADEFAKDVVSVAVDSYLGEECAETAFVRVECLE